MSLEDAIKKANGEQPKTKRPTIDAYVCPDLHVTITKVVEPQGSVPHQIGCPSCKLPAKSMGFHVNQNFAPHFEWYKPSQADILVLTSGMSIPEQNRFTEMIIKGMLISRPAQSPNTTTEPLEEGK